MRERERITEATSLCGDIARDLAELERLSGGLNPRASLSTVEHIEEVLLPALQDQILLLRNLYIFRVRTKDGAQ